MSLDNRTLLSSSYGFAPDLFLGRQVFLTGAGRGIGQAIACGFAACGAELYLVGKDEERLRLLSEQLLTAYGCGVQYKSIDFACLENLQSELDVLARERQFDVVVNNAGIYRTESVAGHELSSWRQLLDINLNAAMLVMSRLLPSMLKRGAGRIINVSSISGRVAEAYGAAYSASKFALLGLTQAAALEAAKSGVTVNAVCPGWVFTDLARTQIEDPHWQTLSGLPADESMELTRLSVPQERFLDPVEVASLVLYLASPMARGITGQAINICGGLSLH